MRWSIQELFVAWSYQWTGIWYNQLIKAPIYIYRNIKTLAYWLLTGRTKESCWNLDGFLLNVIIDKLKQFRDADKMGYPGTLNSQDEWQDIIEEMIVGFEKVKNEEFIDFSKNTYDEKGYRKVFRLFGEYFGNLWD